MKNNTKSEINPGATDKILFAEIFDLDEIQQIQDMFSDATGVASIITEPDGTPITKPSNFCRLCNDIIRKTKKGLANCTKSDAIIGKSNLAGPIVKTCFSGGLWDAGASITVGGQHIANWLIGQVRNDKTDRSRMLDYADEIGANRQDFMEALNEVPEMSVEQFNKVAKMLFTYANDLSVKTYNVLKLSESESKFNSLFMNMSEGAALHKLKYHDTGAIEDYIVTEVNPEFTKQLGISRESIIGKTSREAYGVDEPPYLDIYARVVNSGEPARFETYFEPLKKHFSISAYSPYKGSFATIFKDITLQKQTEETLRISLTKYQVIFDTFPIGITISDSTGQIIETNKIAENLLGVSQKVQEQRTISSDEWHILRADGTIMPVAEFPSIRALKENRCIENVEMGIFKGNNKITWLNVSATPIPIEGFGVAITYNNITERKLAQDALAQSRAELKTIYDHSPVMMCVVDANRKILFANPAFTSLTGLPEDALKGGHACGVFGCINALDDARGCGFGANCRNCNLLLAMEDTLKSGAGHYNIEYAATLIRNGVTHEVTLLGSTALIQNTHDRNLLLCLQDITDLKRSEVALRESEEKHRFLVENAHDVIYTVNAGGILGFVSPSWKALLGHEPDQVIGKSIAEFIHPDDLPACFGFLQKVIETGKRHDGVEYRVKHLNGEWYWHSSSTVPIKNHDGVVTGIEGIAHDVTYNKIAENALKDNESRLRNLNATKDKFFSIIAHDLKNPFNSILGFSDLLKDEARNLDIDSIIQYANIIYSSAQHTYELLENLLEWSRMQQGTIPFEPHPVILSQIADTETEHLNFNASQKNIGLINNIDQKLIITADEYMLSAILRNLTSNAIKFTPKNGKIVISAQEREAVTQISVSDTGVGMSPDTIDKLFKIETSFTTRGTANEKGTGLGLLLCKEFVEKHGGRIWVESVVSDPTSGITGGSTFYFNIPQKHSESI